MRIFFIIILILAICGCLQPKGDNIVSGQNQTEQINNMPEQNQTILPLENPAAEIAGNISAIQPEKIANTSNITENESLHPLPSPAPSEAPPPAPSGLLFGNGTYRLILDSVSMIPTSQEPCGIFSIRSDDAILEKFLICPGESVYWRSPQNMTYRIYVIEVASGNEPWARASIT